MSMHCFTYTLKQYTVIIIVKTFLENQSRLKSKGGKICRKKATWRKVNNKNGLKNNMSVKQRVIKYMYVCMQRPYSDFKFNR